MSSMLTEWMRRTVMAAAVSGVVVITTATAAQVQFASATSAALDALGYRYPSDHWNHRLPRFRQYKVGLIRMDSL